MAPLTTGNVKIVPMPADMLAFRAGLVRLTLSAATLKEVIPAELLRFQRRIQYYRDTAQTLLHSAFMRA